MGLFGIHTKSDHKYYEYRFRVNWNNGWDWVEFDSFEDLHKAIPYILKKRKKIDYIEVFKVTKYHGIDCKEETEKVAKFPYSKDKR